MQVRMQFRSRARHATRRPPRARHVTVAVVTAVAVVVAVPALAAALGHHQRFGHRTQVGGASDTATARAVTTPGPGRGHVPAPTIEPSPEPTAEPTPWATGEPTPGATGEPTPEATQDAPSAAPKPADPAPPVAARSTDPAAQIEADIVAASNAQRAAHGLRALSVSSCATDQVRARVAQLVAENKFYHPPMESVLATCKVGAGENLALGYSDGAGVVDGWMNSAGHRENLLRSSFVSLGVSCQQQNGRWLCGAVYLMS